ncbi:MAG: spermidine synthase [Phenylobacterium sp.]|jgi:spermidine synthase
MPVTNQEITKPITQQQSAILLISILIVALCGITYELIIGTVSSYLLGNSVYQFSLTIGFFMFSMGVGSYLSKFFGDQLLRNFIIIEIWIALIGGAASLLLFMAFPLVNALYNLVMYSLILLIGALVGMEIPILTTLLSERSSTKDSIANVLSIDYVGALIGSVAFPLILLPQLGLIRSSFAIGLINILTAMVNIWFFRDQLKRPKLLLLFSGAIMSTLVVFLFMGSFLTSFAEQHLYFDQIVYTKQTQYQRIVVTESHRTKEQRLYIDGHIQFSARDEYRYHESLVHPVMSQSGKRDNILILGGGDGLAAREVLKYADVKLIHLVDIDPEMTRIAREFPLLKKLNKGSLDHDKLTVFNQDAFTFINQAGILYDRVIIDMPDPHNEAINKLYSREFYKMVKRRMAADGFVVSQSSSPFFTRRTFWCIEQTMDHIFDQTASFQVTVPAFGLWGFNMGSMNGGFVKDYQFDIATRYLNSATMAAAMVFSEDTSKIPSPVNSIMEPKLYQLYIEDLEG